MPANFKVQIEGRSVFAPPLWLLNGTVAYISFIIRNSPFFRVVIFIFFKKISGLTKLQCAPVISTPGCSQSQTGNSLASIRGFYRGKCGFHCPYLQSFTMYANSYTYIICRL